MNEIIEILMRRDGVSYNEAANILETCIATIQDYLENCERVHYDEVADIVADELGLEPDYLDILLAEGAI